MKTPLMTPPTNGYGLTHGAVVPPKKLKPAEHREAALDMSRRVRDGNLNRRERRIVAMLDRRGIEH